MTSLSQTSLALALMTLAGIPLASAAPPTSPVAVAVAGSKSATPPVGNVIDAETSEIEPLIRRFDTDRNGIARFYRLPFSENAAKRRETLLKDWIARLDALDYDRLGIDGRVDYHLLRDDIEYDLRGLAFERQKDAETLPIVPFAPQIVALEEARWKLDPVDGEKAAATLNVIADAAKKAREDKTQKLSPAVALRAANAVRELSGVLGRWYTHYSGFKPLFTWWCRKPYEDTKAQLDQYEKKLREEMAGVKGKDEDPLIGDPIGREALLSDLRHERIPYTPEEMIRLAEQEFTWCEGEMKKASRDMGSGDDWKAALEKVKNDHAEPGGQDDLVAKQAKEAIAFVDAKNLVTIDDLCRETWRVDMVNQDGQKFLPFAAYGGQRMLVAYPTEGMDHATKEMSMRGNNIHFNHGVTAHELIPGHHLQKYMQERHRDYRGSFETPFLVEGWSLYWEMALYDLNYAKTPQDKVGMLFWRMHRCARIIVSLNFHLGKMNPQQMVDFLVDRVGHERFPATSEVRRFISGGYSPLYQCAYMVGGLQLRSLYRDLVMNGKPVKMTPRQFHDAILHQGPISIDLMRARLTNDRLPRVAEPAWKFVVDDSPVTL